MQDTTLDLAADFATVKLSGNGSDFSAITLSKSGYQFTLDALGTVPAFTANVKSLSLDAGTIYITDAQTVTAGDHTISGDVIITYNDALTIGDISADETFKLDNDVYKISAIGLLNSTDSKIVTSGFEDDTLTVDTTL